MRHPLADPAAVASDAGVFTDITPDPSLADVLCGQGADPERLAARAGRHPRAVRRYQRILAVAEQAVQHGRRLIRPHATWAVIPDWRLRAPLLAAGLGDQPDLRQATALVVVAVTIGAVLENEVERLLPVDVAAGAALDSFGSCASQQLGTEVYHRWRAWAAARSLTCSGPVSPGRVEWPVDVAQAELLSLLPAGRTPITANAFGHLHPRKSVSFAIGLHVAGEAPAPDMDLCAPCLVRPTCRWRRAGIRCRRP